MMNIKIMKDGPVILQGDSVKMLLGEKEEHVIALCRCGQSQTKPFCDGNHLKSGFEAEEYMIKVKVGESK